MEFLVDCGLQVAVIGSALAVGLALRRLRPRRWHRGRSCRRRSVWKTPASLPNA